MEELIYLYSYVGAIINSITYSWKEEADAIILLPANLQKKYQKQ